MDEAFTFVREAGDALDAKADGVAQALPDALVYAGISWGVGAAQRLAQTRAGARGALLYEACFPITGEYAFGPWPTGMPVQIHGKADDEFFAHEGDIDAARELVAMVGPDQAALFVYPGAEHLFVDSSLPSYDPTQRRWPWSAPCTSSPCCDRQLPCRVDLAGGECLRDARRERVSALLPPFRLGFLRPRVEDQP